MAGCDQDLEIPPPPSLAGPRDQEAFLEKARLLGFIFIFSVGFLRVLLLLVCWF